LLGLLLVILLAAGVFLLTDDPVVPPNEQEETINPSSPTAEPTAQTLPEDQRWLETLDADTPYGYQRFLKDYPASVHRDEALKLMGQLDDAIWSEADAEGTKLSYLAYLDEFPAGRHEPEAMIRLNVLERTEAEGERQRIQQEQDDQLAWNQARIKRTLSAVDRYLEMFPLGLHEEEARRLRRTLNDESKDAGAYGTAQKLNTIDAYQAYIDAFPRGKHVADALMEIDNLTLNVGKIFRDCANCPRMVVLPSGTFWQGADQDSPAALANEKPSHQVVFSNPFAMSINEISFKQWDSCVTDGFCSIKPGDNGWGRDSRPIIMVSWNDAQEYINWINQKTGGQYRLPSESEWEYAARAGETDEWPGGASSLICESGNIAGTETGLKWQHPDCSDKFALQTAPAGSFQPNAFGLNDMSGNVAEWTLDCMNLTYIDAPSDGSAWNRGMCSSHMTRGGSWFTGSRESRLSSRFNLKAGDRNDFTGFRIVRSVEQ
jgi:formylglycine-generating enzyme required for sulfatase activity